MRTLLGMVCGAGFGLGVYLLAAGATPRPRGTAGQPHRWSPARLARGRGPVHLAGVLVAVAVAGLLTRWPVAALAAGVAAWALPGMVAGSGRTRAARVARLEALATWTESLAATLSAAAGLEQAIAVSAWTGPPPIRAALTGLADAGRHGVRLPLALAAFAQDLDDPVADTIVATLLLAATHGGANLREPLGMLADATREEVAARRQVETSRAAVTTDVRLVLGVAGTVIGALVVFNRGFLAPYDGFSGQLVLAVLAAASGGALAWLGRLSRYEEPSRIITLTPLQPDIDAATAVRAGIRGGVS